MPSYASLQDLDECGLPLAALATIPKTTIQRQLDRASAYVDTFLGDKVQLSLVGAPDPIIVMTVCQIASWWLLVRRGFNPENPGDAVVRQSYLDAVTFLTRIANGQARINVKQSNPESLQPNVSSNELRGYGNVTGDGATDAPIIVGGSNWGG